MPTKVFLDSNVLVRLVLEKDRDVQAIIEASRNGELETYVSWLALTEISKLISRLENSAEVSEKTKNVLREGKIRITSKFDPSLSSGTISPLIGDLHYSDYLHLSIADKMSADFFLTYDAALLKLGKFKNLRVLEPNRFRKEVLGV